MAQQHYDATTRALQPHQQHRTHLQRFHNDAKRALLETFASRATSLLDLACGRGGDIHKWHALGIAEVRGLDVSGESVAEARSRYANAAHAPNTTTYTFQQADLREGWRGDRPYDVIACMFALHYFFGSEQDAHTLLRTVSANLRPGGYFVGIVPDGLMVNERIRHGTFDNGIMRVQALWSGKPACFGSAYTCCIKDTVTAAATDVHEFLVYGSVLAAVASTYGLKPVAIRHRAFEAPGSDGVFHRLRPPYGGPAAEVSSMYAAFAFQKTCPATASGVPQNCVARNPC